MDENQKPLPPRLEDVPPESLIRVGGPVDRVRVSLRLSGDDLDPAEVTEKLGCRPTEARRRGEILPDARYHRVARTGSWRLEGTDEPSIQVEKQVTNLLERLTGDPAVWRDLSGRFSVDVFCGVFLEAFNRGFVLSPTLLRQLADRGLEIGFDIYGA